MTMLHHVVYEDILQHPHTQPHGVRLISYPLCEITPTKIMVTGVARPTTGEEIMGELFHRVFDFLAFCLSSEDEATDEESKETGQFILLCNLTRFHN